MASSSIQLLNTMEFAKKFNFARAAALGNFMEPALTSANTIMQTIMAPPFRWRWNRAVTGFNTIAGIQDYVVFIWQPNFQVQNNWSVIDPNGYCQQCTTSGIVGATPPTWNPVQGDSTTDGTAVWVNTGFIGVNGFLSYTYSQSYTFGWIETCSIQDIVNGQPKWFELPTKLCLSLDSAQGRPANISAQSDDGFGNITYRLMQVPDAVYPVAITIQQKPPLFTKTSQTWAPIPDDYSHIYNWGFLSLMWMFADDPRFTVGSQKFVAQLLSSAEGLTETERNIFLNNWYGITGQPAASMERLQQGNQARGT